MQSVWQRQIRLVIKNRHGFRLHQSKATRLCLGTGQRAILEESLKPFLMDGKKHDLRVYVAIVSYEPFVAFINEEGLARFCTEDYDEPVHR
mgnify:CR=1 FL=1